MALLATHGNESPVPTVAQAFLPAAPRFVSALFAGARASGRMIPPRTTFNGVPMALQTTQRNESPQLRSLRSCEEMPEFENTIAWGDTKSLDGPSERVVGLLMRPPAVENSRFSAVLIISQLLTVAAPIGAPTVREGLPESTEPRGQTTRPVRFY